MLLSFFFALFFVFLSQFHAPATHHPAFAKGPATKDMFQSNKTKKICSLLRQFQPIARPSGIAPPGGLASGLGTGFGHLLAGSCAKFQTASFPLGMGQMIGGAAPPAGRGWKGFVLGRPITARLCPPPTCLLSGAHQVTSALGWRSGAGGAIAAEPRRIQPFLRMLGCSGP